MYGFKYTLKNVKIIEISGCPYITIDAKNFLLQKNLFDLKLKKFTSQNVKPHLFTHTKHRLAQLQFKKSCLIKKEK